MLAMADELQEAQSLYTESLDASRDQRQQISDDLLFSDPSNPQQWDESVRVAREQDPGGKRPCLVMDQTGQYVANVAGQVEKTPPAIHAVPVGGGADKKAAEQIDGRFRHIEYASKAQQHYTRALTSAARAGVGYLVVRPEYVNRALGWQEPRIGSESDPLRVVFDPWSVNTDGSDANFGYLLTSISQAEFKRQYPKKDLCDFGDLERTKRFDNRESVLLAEQWAKVESSKTVLVWAGPDGAEASGSEDEYQAAMPSGVQYIRSYKDKTQAIKWRRMSGADVLEEADYPADWIGIVPIYGYVGFADGRMKYCGIPRRARVPQQAYNYHVSEQLAYIGTAPKSPWLASKRALKGVEQIWDRASTQARAFLPFNDLDEDGQISAPTRSNQAANLVNHEAGAAQALRDIQASIGMYAANIGARSNVVSGVAYDAQKEQGEASTAHFPAHLAASVGQVGQIVMQMDARLSDTRRKQPIVGVDGSSGSVQVDPDQQEAFQRIPGQGVVINPRIGQYSVRVVVGASYTTQRKETNAAFAEIMRGNPELAPTVAPFWAQTLDFPGSDKFAQALAAMAPPPVKAILQPEGAENEVDPAKLAQELEQCKQALAEAIQHAHDAQKDADEAIASEAASKRAVADKERELDINSYKAETDRLKVTGANEDQITAITTGLVNEMLMHPDPDEDQAEDQTEGMPMQGKVSPLAAQVMPQVAAQVMPHVQALQDGQDMLAQNHAKLAESQQAIAQGHGELLQGHQAVVQGQDRLAQMLQELADLTRKPRRRVPVRDKQGNITEVIDSVNED